MKKSAYKLTVFFIWPFGGFLKSASNYFSTNGDRALLTLFSGFVGLNIAITSDAPDINRYRENFIDYQKYNFDFLQDYFVNFFRLQDKYYDVGIQILNFVISRFTDNVHIYFFILGLIYGVFYAYIITFLGRYIKNLKSPLILKLLLFITTIFIFFPTQGINQFRFWTASVLFICGFLLLPYSRKRAIILILASPLMHIGTGLLVVGLVLINIFHKVKTSYLIWLLPFAIALNLGLSDVLNPIAAFFGGSIEGKINNYTGELASERLESFQNRVWYAAYWRNIALFGLAVLTITIYKQVERFSKPTISLYRLNLVFLFFGLLMQGFFMHFRYYELFIFMQIVFVVTYLFETKSLSNGMGSFKRIGISVIMLLILMIKIPAALQFLIPTFFITNFFTAWFVADMNTVSIWDILGL